MPPGFQDQAWFFQDIRDVRCGIDLDLRDHNSITHSLLPQRLLGSRGPERGVSLLLQLSVSIHFLSWMCMVSPWTTNMKFFCLSSLPSSTWDVSLPSLRAFWPGFWVLASKAAGMDACSLAPGSRPFLNSAPRFLTGSGQAFQELLPAAVAFLPVRDLCQVSTKFQGSSEVKWCHRKHSGPNSVLKQASCALVRAQRRAPTPAGVRTSGYAPLNSSWETWSILNISIFFKQIFFPKKSINTKNMYVQISHNCGN